MNVKSAIANFQLQRIAVYGAKNQTTKYAVPSRN